MERDTGSKWSKTAGHIGGRVHGNRQRWRGQQPKSSDFANEKCDRVGTIHTVSQGFIIGFIIRVKGFKQDLWPMTVVKERVRH